MSQAGIYSICDITLYNKQTNCASLKLCAKNLPWLNVFIWYYVSTLCCSSLCLNWLKLLLLILYTKLQNNHILLQHLVPSTFLHSAASVFVKAMFLATWQLILSSCAFSYSWHKNQSFPRTLQTYPVEIITSIKFFVIKFCFLRPVLSDHGLG